MAADPVFVDTNVLVYVDQAASAFHTPARAAIARLERDGAQLWISRQVLREYLVTVTRPGPSGVPPMTRSEAAAAAEGFLATYAIAEDGPEATTHLLKWLRAVPVGGKQLHDANVVATMLARGVTRPLTSNAADFRASSRWSSSSPYDVGPRPGGRAARARAAGGSARSGGRAVARSGVGAGERLAQQSCRTASGRTCGPEHRWLRARPTSWSAGAWPSRSRRFDEGPAGAAGRGCAPGPTRVGA
jgi:predicted nucleic acid-binding protein